MRVLPINILNTNYAQKKSAHREADKSGNASLIQNPNISNISFMRVAKNAEPLRKLMKYGAIDIWTEKPVIDPDYIKYLLQKQVFDKPLTNVVKILSQLKSTFNCDVVISIYELLVKIAKIYPEAHLDEIFKIWDKQAQKDLITIQVPIFAEIEEMSHELPEKAKEEFDALMYDTRKQLRQKPILKEFSKKEFRYKLGKASKRIKQTNITEEVEAMNRILLMSEDLPTVHNSPLHKSNKKFHDKSLNEQKTAFRHLKSFFERSALAYDKELQNIFNDANCRVHGIETFIPFGRLNFIEALKNITKNIDDQPLARKMIQKASELPTASEEVSAFIVKASRNSSSKIGYDLLWYSEGNIDHLETFSSGGKDKLSNYVISTNYTNSKRGNSSFAQQLRTNPKRRAHADKYLEKFVEFENKGILKLVGLNNAYITNLAKKFYRLSPAENRFFPKILSYD